ncbi:MAG: hypothetical protein AAGH15_12305 [Myxococcota bacterium]
MAVASLFGLGGSTDAAARRAHWHVSPFVDTAAYAFSWLPVLVPMMLVGNSHRLDYLAVYLVILAFTDVHRHYGYPYVYMDGQIFQRHPLRFTVFPALMLVFFFASPTLATGGYYLSGVGLCAASAGVVALIQVISRDRSDQRPSRKAHLLAVGAGLVAGLVAMAFAQATFTPADEFDRVDRNWGPLVGLLAFTLALDVLARREAGAGARKIRFIAPALVLVALGVATLPEVTDRSVRFGQVLNAAAVFAGLWNIWHVYMQKYGIFRMYNAKNGSPDKVPGWVDRLLIVCWLPLYLFYVGPTYRTEVFRLFSRGRELLSPLFDGFEALAGVMLVPSIGLVVFAIANFLRWELKVNGLQNRARLTMALGTTLLSTTFLFLHPLKAYLAYAFSHAIEYMVFVWAFQRRRYAEPLAHKPSIERFLRYPLVTYIGTAVLLGLAFTYLKYYGRWIFTDVDQPELAGLSTARWVGYWTVYQSMVHFYFDGFLWKMRLPTVRATVGASDVPAAA